MKWKMENDDEKVTGGRRMDWKRFSPDGDVGTLSQSASCTLQPCVDLSHLYGPFQPNHLQQLVTEVWMEKDTEQALIF